jgi:hypothetical protein
MATFNYRAKSFSAVNFQLQDSRQILAYSSDSADVSVLTLTVLMAILFIFPLILKQFFWEKVKKIKIIKKILEKNLVYPELISTITLSYAFPTLFMSWTYVMNYMDL